MTAKKYVGDIHWNELNQLTQPLSQPSFDMRTTQTATATQECNVGHFIPDVLNGKSKITGIVLRSTPSPYPYIASGAEKLYSEFGGMASEEPADTSGDKTDKTYWRYQVMIPVYNGILQAPGSVVAKTLGSEQTINYYTTALPSPGLWGSDQEGKLAPGTFVDIIFENNKRGRIPYVIGANRDRTIQFDTSKPIVEQYHAPEDDALSSPAGTSGEKVKFRETLGANILTESDIGDARCRGQRATPHPPGLEKMPRTKEFHKQIEQFGENNWRSCQPTLEQLEWLIKEKGVKRVVRLNGGKPDDPKSHNDAKVPGPGGGIVFMKDEEKLCRKLNVEWKFVNAHKGGGGRGHWKQITPGKGYDASIKKALVYMNQGDCFVHCHHGADRTGMIVGAYKKANGIVPSGNRNSNDIKDLEWLWKDAIQYNSWGCKRGVIYKGEIAYAKYLDGFYPLDLWLTAGDAGTMPSGADRKKSCLYSKILDSNGNRTKGYASGKKGKLKGC